jgi:hypothetical protein
VAGTQTLYISVQNGNTAPTLQSLTLSPTSIGGGAVARQEARTSRKNSKSEKLLIPRSKEIEKLTG